MTLLCPGRIVMYSLAGSVARYVPTRSVQPLRSTGAELTLLTVTVESPMLPVLRATVEIWTGEPAMVVAADNTRAVAAGPVCSVASAAAVCDVGVGAGVAGGGAGGAHANPTTSRPLRQAVRHVRLVIA